MQSSGTRSSCQIWSGQVPSIQTSRCGNDTQFWKFLFQQSSSGPGSSLTRPFASAQPTTFHPASQSSSSTPFPSLVHRDFELSFWEKETGDFTCVGHMKKLQGNASMFLPCPFFPCTLVCASSEMLWGMTATLPPYVWNISMSPLLSKKIITRGSPTCVVSSFCKNQKQHLFRAMTSAGTRSLYLSQEQDNSNPLTKPLDTLRTVSLFFGRIATEMRIL